MTGRRVARAGLAIALGALVAGPGVAQTTPEQLHPTLDLLGDFDYAVRMEASRTVRRAPPEVAVPLLVETVSQHPNSYVQFRAIVLLDGFGDARTRSVFEAALASPNDRLRAVAYDYFEQEPDPGVIPKLLAAFDTETSEFVRPALVRALAAHDDNAAVRERLVRDIDRGEGFFRGAVIEALGDRSAEYALEPLVRIAQEAGSLQDDALLALGKIGGAQAEATLRAVQRNASETLQPVVSSAACLLNIDYANQLLYVTDALRYGAEIADGDSQDLVRSAASGLAALAVRGNRDALDALFETGQDARGAARAPIALALGTVALRSPDIVRAALEERPTPDADLLLLRDAFDMLDEDFAEERFYVLMRSAYWAGAEGSDQRRVAEAAIEVLEF